MLNIRRLNIEQMKLITTFVIIPIKWELAACLQHAYIIVFNIRVAVVMKSVKFLLLHSNSEHTGYINYHLAFSVFIVSIDNRIQI